MNGFRHHRLGLFFGLFVLAVVLASALVVGLVAGGSFTDWLELLVIVAAGLGGFLLVIAMILLVGVVFAFLIARVISFLHP